MMAEWAEQVWLDATDSPTATTKALDATWSAERIGNVHEVIYDASCVAPATNDFAGDADDLFAD
jgi:hypothetical protein